ncbi:LamG-like jellyroll fold domain-containing protein [uncultured Psychroserpens sp.]|uniref:LamG-like jellyroll fold domain-containing protein n=1 Tax=uncultured Psychroserpens sp. TaxID=255436 RepID=UPI002639E8E9|nr:LamG-like jellyroll fold domain-containing protein [uncultured Psychroserpens sp.]
MRTKLLLCLLAIFFICNKNIAQNSDVQITVKWGGNSFENKVEIYNTANDLIATICDDNQCYVSTQAGVTDQYGAKYDLGCVTNGNNYYIKMYDIANDGWQSGYVTVTVAGVQVINDNGTSASTTGSTVFFNVSGGDATCNAQLDTDQDGYADYLDYDDDGDGITDGAENLGQDRFECTLPELKFENGSYDAAASTAAEGLVGSVYRFGNAIQGYDVLMEVTEMTNATIANIDVDTVDNPTYLQTELNLTGVGTPGVTFKFTVVNSGTTTPSTEIFRINGITWDCDGSGSMKESVVYYNPAAYGTENPTSLEVLPVGSDVQISASGLQEGPGFSTLKVLRAYYQFIGNSFTMRMQGIKTGSSTTKRQFGMSFTQCEFLDFNANSLVIITGEDFDNDGKYNHLDLDSDNDGIPDNVEGQTTLGYVAPVGSVSKFGIDTAYGEGIITVDTDDDNTPDVLDLDTDNDGLLDIKENGMADNISSFSDADNDGLDLLFEGSNTNDPLDVNDDINTPESSVLPDTDGDLYTGGDLDYRDLFNTNPPPSATLDFDGVDDYVVGTSVFSPITQTDTDGVTLMAWVKSDSNASDTNEKFVFGEENAIEVYITDKEIRATIKFVKSTGAIASRTIYKSTLEIERNVWRHIAVKVSFTDNRAYLFLDGEEAFSTNLINAVAFTSSTTSDEEVFRIGNRETLLSSSFFKGAIDEIRVFNTNLTEEEIQEIVYQEIENVGGQLKGAIIENTIDNVDWSNLELYYPLSNVQTNIIKDHSPKARDAKMYNITTIQEQTAPMPFETKQNGRWDHKDTWLHGDVWYIPGDEITQAASSGDDELISWGIYHIKNDVNLITSLDSQEGILALGLIVDSNNEFSVGDNSTDLQLNVSKYLKLDGTIDLSNDSQLIQGSNSDLVTSATGKILRRQEGNSSVYWYNYWSSPVGQLGATSLADNNTNTNNPNNSDYRLNMLKKGDGSAVEFTSAYDEVGKVSISWLYSYKNGIEYWDWSAVTPTSPVEPGVGYTQKGTGTSDSNQQFIFEGKPNNGTILIDVIDTGGNGSVPAVSKTDYLLGNPYASALDIHQFIDDNAGVIDGTLQLWQQWSGTSHNLDEYDGGYAQVNKMGSVRAYQFVGIEGANNGSQDGTKTPTRYLPVGQGFMTEIVADGTIEFNNGQRVFKKESDYAGNYNNGSIFFRNANTEEDSSISDETTEEPIMQKVRLEFSSVDGPATRRELLLGFSNFTSDDYDYGYDAKNVDENEDDLNLIFENQFMTMQAYSAISDDKIVPLSLMASGSYNYKIKATQFENFEEEQAIYLKDNLTGTYFDLKSDLAYEFSSDEGEFNNRFEIVFQSEQESLSTNDDDYQYNLIYFNNDSDKLFAKGLQTDVDQLMFLNILGQSVRAYKNLTAQELDNGIEVSNLSTGTYVVYLKMGSRVETKKIIIN